MSRSTWACELKSRLSFKCGSTSRHAPRERVSWNRPERLRRGAPLVTLHVSVWVEIIHADQRDLYTEVTLHVSVWVEIYFLSVVCIFFLSRSTWACELKFLHFLNKEVHLRHAPRERVSWNLCLFLYKCCNRVTLHVSVWVEIFCETKYGALQKVTLHVSVWVEIFALYLSITRIKSRSTWACELK